MNNCNLRRPMALTSVILLLVFLCLGQRAAAQDLQVTEVNVSGRIDCNSHSTWLFVIRTSGPCSSFEKPPKVRVGETFMANGRSIVIGIIIAHYVAEELDLPQSNTELKRGDFYCVAAENEDQLPSDEERERIWLYMPLCDPMLEGDPQGTD